MFFFEGMCGFRVFKRGNRILSPCICHSSELLPTECLYIWTRFNRCHLGLLPCSCHSRAARHKIKPPHVSVATGRNFKMRQNFPAQQEEAATAGKGSLARIQTETWYMTSERQAHSASQTPRTDVLTTSCVCRHLRLTLGSKQWSRALYEPRCRCRWRPVTRWPSCYDPFSEDVPTFPNAPRGAALRRLFVKWVGMKCEEGKSKGAPVLFSPLARCERPLQFHLPFSQCFH